MQLSGKILEKNKQKTIAIACIDLEKAYAGKNLWKMLVSKWTATES